jgi:molybdopterin-guanine dinucleotide biosynthesis protein A
MIERHDVTGIIVCGGEGSRLGGRDKPLEPIHGTPLVGHVYRRLAPQVARVIVSCNRNELAYAPWGDAVVRDAARGRGPLSGVLAALEEATTRYVFVCPGDAPCLSDTIVARLGAAVSVAAPLAIPHDGERAQVLFTLFDRAALQPALGDYFDRGGRSVHGWIESVPHAIVDYSDDSTAFFNVNSWDDLADAARRIAPQTNETAHTR